MLSPDAARLREMVATRKRVQHLKPVEPALATIFRSLNLNDLKFSERLQLRSNVTLIGA
jgi:hypothetical protein